MHPFIAQDLVRQRIRELRKNGERAALQRRAREAAREERVVRKFRHDGE